MKTIVLTLFLCISMLPGAALAKTVTFEENYIYDASEADSKLTCRAISLIEVKKLLLERLGTYVQSETEVINLQLTKDEVTTLTAGVVKTEIIDERWDGRSYSLTARVEVDPNSVAKMIDELINNGEGREKIEKLKSMNDDALGKIEQLKNEMVSVQENLVTMNRDYQMAAKVVDSLGAFDRGMDFLREEEYSDAAEEFTKAIEMDARYNHYLMRGKAYKKLRKFDLALADFDKSLEMKEKVPEALFQKGQIYMKKREKRKGVKLIKKSARQGNGKARLWLKSKGKSY